ncbi:sensor domain-containing diguanylate cyclase [Trinickia caryophylli]|nr:GGDEF domain-containing protein [Trinickia caryophylli]TRX20201.1 sensor domain-containing diguanylate cyclase [Trinickia caryophylli]
MGRRFAIGVAIALVPMLVLSYVLLAYEWTALARVNESMRHFRAFRATLSAMEKISAERGPMNGVLGEDQPVPATRTILLRRARIDSDDQLAQLFDLLRPEKCPSCEGDYAAVKQLKADLAATRAEADRLAALPRAARGDRAVEEVIARMFRVVDGFGPIAVSRTTFVARGAPSVFNCLMIARIAADLREHAGRLGSQLTAALALGRPLTIDERLAIAYTRGRIEQLRTAINVRMVDLPALSVEAFAPINTRYFGEGLTYVSEVEARAQHTGGAGVSTGQFAERYVPTMLPIIGFRDAVMARAQTELQRRRDSTRVTALAVTASDAVLLMAFAWVAIGFRRDIVRPFVQATECIRAIASGDYAREVPATFSRLEVRTMFEAIRTLKENSIARARLETERARLIEELATMAETDSLTRLLNRRAFESRARAMCEQGHDAGSPVALIMFDLDYFKRINDTHGHAVGDDALRLVARLCRQQFRRTDIVARIGGEEFAVMTRVQNVDEAQAMAERMRQEIADAMLATDSGTPCRMSASFGVAHSSAERPDLARLFKQADQLLYEAKLAGRNRVMTQPLAPNTAGVAG